MSLVGLGAHLSRSGPALKGRQDEGASGGREGGDGDGDGDGGRRGRQGEGRLEGESTSDSCWVFRTQAARLGSSIGYSETVR